ncbi:MAG: hypothetical protein JO013_00100 [Alphaproteobacteria bacterium]|nr:hypothetical protein [Alphaproteobacteria bacterium]
MNAPAVIPGVGQTVPPGAEGQAELFTGRFLKKVAEFEIWMVRLIAAADPTARIDTLIGKRVGALRAAVEKRPEIVRDRKRVEELLDRLQPYLALRAELAHGCSTTLTSEDGKRIYLFETASACPAHLWKVRTVIREDEIAVLYRGLSQIINELRQQTPPTPSSPRPRAPA